MMARVQARGGLASYMIFGTELSAGHHNEEFDHDERDGGSGRNPGARRA